MHRGVESHHTDWLERSHFPCSLIMCSCRELEVPHYREREGVDRGREREIKGEKEREILYRERG